MFLPLLSSKAKDIIRQHREHFEIEEIKIRKRKNNKKSEKEKWRVGILVYSSLE